MTTSAKRAPKQDNVVESPAFRVPASLEEAYELGWEWQCESFVGLGQFGRTKDGVTRREGLAHFVSKRKTDSVVIPFVATYEFGTPRQPERPYTGGSVLSVDEEPEPPQELTPEEHEAERIALWKVQCNYRERTLKTFKIRGTQNQALDKACDGFLDKINYTCSEITDQPAVEESTTPQDHK